MRRRGPPGGIRPFALAALAALAAGCGTVLPAAPGTVLFQDGFDRRSSGWDVYQRAESLAEYQDGTYRLRVDVPNTVAWGTPGFRLGDVRLDVDAAAVAGPLDNVFGLVCRFQDPDNFYFLLISSDGYSGIGVVRDGVRTLLTGAAMLPSDFIFRGMASNHLQAECRGDELRLAVNGVLINEATATDWSTGDVGLLAGSYQTGGVEVHFDNFAVTQP
jgi:hypothetical protein